MKKALITGISGQDGSYLAEYLLSLGYEVFGIVRRNVDLRNLSNIKNKLNLIYGDVRDALSIQTAIQKAQPDEIYNLAGQVFVPTSWLNATETMNVNYGGLVRILEYVEKFNPKIRVYQASTSEMFGNSSQEFLDELTSLNPESPYAVSKVAAHNLCKIYRETKHMFVCGGILMNHESPRRGMEMVTRKITHHVAAWMVLPKDKWPTLELGNLSGTRDWGFAGDYVKAMHAMLQLNTPEDFVIGTGVAHTVSEFLGEALKKAKFVGKNNTAMEVPLKVGSSVHNRPTDIKRLRANPAKAEALLGWKAKTTFPTLVKMMLDEDVKYWQTQMIETVVEKSWKAESYDSLYNIESDPTLTERN